MNEYIILICHLVRRRWNFKYTQKSTQALKYLFAIADSLYYIPGGTAALGGNVQGVVQRIRNGMPYNADFLYYIPGGIAALGGNVQDVVQQIRNGMPCNAGSLYYIQSLKWLRVLFMMDYLLKKKVHR